MALNNTVPATNDGSQPGNSERKEYTLLQEENMATINNKLFNALQNVDLDSIDDIDLEPALPFLAKLLLTPSFTQRKVIIRKLYKYRRTNDIIQLIRAKNVDTLEPITALPASRFESAGPEDRLKMVAIEYLRIQELARQSNLSSSPNSKLIPSDLFDNQLYLVDVMYCLYTLIIKSVGITVINILDMSEALLHVKNGPILVIRLILNMPDRCREVCHSLIAYGEKQDESSNFNEVSEQRAKTLRMLCRINPEISFTVRAATLQIRKMPSLTIMITLDQLKDSMINYKEALERHDHSDVMDDEEDVSPKEREETLEQIENSYDNVVAFITGILLGDDEGTRSWFAQYTKLAQTKRIDQGNFTILSELRTQLMEYIKLLFPCYLDEDHNDRLKSEKSAMNLNRNLIRATATLRLYCALRGIGSLKPNAEESETLLSLITCKPDVNQTSVNFATTGVCTLLSCSSLINNQKEERRAAEWLKWLIKESNYSDTRYSSHGKCSISELLLLIAIHFQNNQTSQIAELVCATLGMKLQIKPSVSKCKSLFVQEVFNDQMVTEHAVKVPVTKNLDNNIVEFLPIHCIHQLLESRSFSKHQVPIKDWIYKQICESKKPIHQMLPKLIEAYVNSVIISTSVHGHCGTNQAIPESAIACVFKTQLYSIGSKSNFVPSVNELVRGEEEMDCDNTEDQDKPEPVIVDVEVAQTLLLYYLLLYEDVRLKKNMDMSASEKTKLVRYSPDFMMEVPIFYLLQLVRDNQDSFGLILPDLLKLVTSQYPQLCSIQHWLTTEHYESYRSKTVANLVSTQDDQVLKAIKSMVSRQTNTNRDDLIDKLRDGFANIRQDPLSLVKTINQITVLPRNEIWPFLNVFIDNWSKILSLEVDSSSDYTKLIQVITRLWWKFNTIFPRKLWVMTVNSLRKLQYYKAASDIKSVEYSWDELALDPLIVLRCDSRVFRCPSILSILLHVLDAFLAASRRCLQDQINEQSGRNKDVRSLEELRTTLVLAQTSAAIQILLESCIPSDDEQEAINKQESEQELSCQEKSLLVRFDSSVSCICEHLHQVFIADTNLAKLVHFQTYPSDLLATTCSKVPSMHICLDFIPELLAQPDLSKQVFVIELSSHLCEKYAITKSLNVAKLCFNVAYTLLQLLPSERRASFYVPVLPALLTICRVFPILREDATVILNQINQITLAHMASTSSRLSLSSAHPFEGLEKMNWRMVKKMSSNLGPHEALYLYIQKCLLDLNKLKESDKKKLAANNSIQQVYGNNSVFAYGNHVTNPTGD